MRHRWIVCWLVLLPWLSLNGRDAMAQESVELEQVRDYLNRRVSVEGEVADVRRQKNGEVWLSLGRAYPRAAFARAMTGASGASRVPETGSSS